MNQYLQIQVQSNLKANIQYNPAALINAKYVAYAL